MRVDLHTHTARSDGALAPAELVRQAYAAGLDCIAVTDHDSLAGIPEALDASEGPGLLVIVGVELSVRDTQGNDDHLLGLFVDPASVALDDYLRRLQAGRTAMAEQTLQALARLGVPVSAERVAELARGAVVTRPHIARALLEAGHVASEQEAFDRFLGNGRPAATERPAPDHATAIRTVRGAGGVAVLAHPVFPKDANASERLAALPARLAELREMGLHGVECFYPDAPPALREQLAGLAGPLGLIATGGTDYHGPGKAPYAALGEVTVDADTLTALESQAAST